MGRGSSDNKSRQLTRQPGLLSRDDFRAAVFHRDDNRCVICQAKVSDSEGIRLDAHHIIERRLFEDGGYYLANGATLCDRRSGEGCHLKAEQTLISCEEIRQAANIEEIILPAHLERGDRYTKWGDTLFADGRRAPGELFNDAAVQKALADGGALALYTPYIKYPRTPHLPWSPGRSADDIEAADLSRFSGQQVVVTAKLDGESCTMTRDRMYARSPDGNFHPSQAWARALHGKLAWELPERYRFCGENLYAEHSINYQNLPSYFFLFSIWNENNQALSWDETVEWAALLGVETVPVLYRGEWDEEAIKACYPHSAWGNEPEGYVVRLAERFDYSSFRQCVAKFVRPNHVQTDQHWRSKAVVANKLAY